MHGKNKTPSMLKYLQFLLSVTILIRLDCGFLLLVFLLSVAPPASVRAEYKKAVCDGLSAVEWQETRTQAFAILYSVESLELGGALSTWYGETLDAEYARFEALFETSLSLPVFIRIYPTENHLYCLNAEPPEIQTGVTHHHIGSREIALIAENIEGSASGNASEWLRNSLNIFRYEQAILFSEQISDRQAPPGLLAAIGHYAQDPQHTLGKLNLPRGEWFEPAQTWQTLWEDPGTQFEFRQGLETTSIVAFLVDQYGWPSFLQFLNSLRTSGGYRLSLTQMYAADFSALQEQWNAYFGEYFQGRWQINAIYNYDLSPYQDLLVAGEYRQASKGLKEVIPFLEKISQTEKLNQAHAMLEWAITGQEADDLILQSEQALQRGEYQQSLVLANLAEEKYTRIKNFNHLDALSAFRDRVRKILVLHAELERLGEVVAVNKGGIRSANQIITLGQHLGELQDIQGQIKAQELARMVEAHQRNQQVLFSMLGAALILILLGIRIWLMLFKTPPEAEL